MNDLIKDLLLLNCILTISPSLVSGQFEVRVTCWETLKYHEQLMPFDHATTEKIAGCAKFCLTKLLENEKKS
jgi:hypothetical protein